ncbi:MAG: hypothetical protein JSS10_02895 [Verrucomicrobia bacterium]|nr:hypothetical protein [Verrucomicrobiota bacterium]
MDKLIKDTISLLKEEASQGSSILATPEEMAYFSPQKKQNPAATKDKKALEIDAEMKQMVAKILPETSIVGAIPDDAHAKKMSQLYKEQHLTAQVLVLSLGEAGPGLQFLQNVTKAIDSMLAPAKLIEMRKIERENSWDITLNSPTLKLIVAPPFETWKSISLARFYRANPSSKSHFLRETPVAFMQPSAAYLKNPDLKRELWKMLSTLLSTST